MKKVIVLFSLMVLAISFLPIAAQESDYTPPPQTPADNECYDGGTLAGKCNTTDANGDGIISEGEQTYMWECGWALARYNRWIMPKDAVPERCYSFLPETPQPNPALPIPRGSTPQDDETSVESSSFSISLVDVGNFNPNNGCLATVDVMVSGPVPLALTGFVHNAFYGDSLGAAYPTRVFSPGKHTVRYRLGGRHLPEYYDHRIVLQSSDGTLSNVTHTACKQ